jgi:hypothetical protein
MQKTLDCLFLVLLTSFFTIACQTKALNNSDLPRAKNILIGLKKVGLILNYRCHFERKVKENKQDAIKNESCSDYNSGNNLGSEQVTHSLFNIFSNWQLSQLDRYSENSIIQRECKSKIFWFIPIVDVDNCISEISKRRKLMSESKLDALMLLNIEILGRNDDSIIKNLFKINSAQPILFDVKYEIQLFDNNSKEPVWIENMESSLTYNEYQFGILKFHNNNKDFLEKDSTEKFNALRQKIFN